VPESESTIDFGGGGKPSIARLVVNPDEPRISNSRPGSLCSADENSATATRTYPPVQLDRVLL